MYHHSSQEEEPKLTLDTQIERKKTMQMPSIKMRDIILIPQRYPVPILALASLIIGSVLHWILGITELAHWLWIATLVIGGIPVVVETVKGMLKKHFASDIVAMLAILAALILNDAFPGVIIVLMQTGGRALEDYAYRHASSSLNELLARSPRTAHRRRDDVIDDIDVKQVRVGDTLLVRPGDLVPVDGCVSAGYRAQLDESALTGEALPKPKDAGAKVYSGTVNVGGAFEIMAEAPSGESQYAKIVELVRKAQQEKAPIQRLADKYAVWFTPITLAVSAAGWAITGDLQTILAVLVVATPCSLIFATPVAIISGINKASKKGIIVKHGAALEQVGKTQAVVFDKTGTITYGTPEVEAVISLDATTSEDDLLYKAASLEQLSAHPVARMLVANGREKFGKLAIPQNFHEIPGAGVEGYIDGDHVLIGSSKIIVESDEEQRQMMASSVRRTWQGGKKMLAFIAINGRPKGVVVFGDRVRPGVVSMINELASLGVKKAMMLTGDDTENAQAVAEEAGLTDFKANLLPQEKVSTVRELKEEYQNVIMVGDGINDAPALASATVGVAMGARGAAISAEAADIVLLVDDVTRVSRAIKIGSRTIQVAKESIFVGLGASLALMIIASFGLIPPAAGALLQEALDVAVILNALRAR
jgi:heavy metal translocating P-type ATPase